MTEPSDHTFYSATAKPVRARPPLAQDIETEVCVVGGGFAGLWAARALAARGQEVVLLEAGEIAGGASGRNGGFVSAGFAAKLSKIVARVGLDHARELYRLSREGVEIVRAATAADSAAMQVQPGRLHVLRYNDEVGLSDHAGMLARDFGHELEFWRTDRVRRTLASGQYYQALHEPDAFHLNPLKLARLLAAEFEDRGGRIFEQSRVLEADVGGLRKSLVTEHGRVRAFNVVIAGSAGIGEAFPWLAKTILPIRTHVAVTAPLGDELKRAIRYTGAVADTRRASDYYHLMGERLLWGGRISARRNPPRRLAQLMGHDIARVYPQLGQDSGEVPIEYAWSGVMGYAVHLMPQIGMAQPGVWVASAFGGQGLNTTAMAGELIASAIVEQDDRWRLFIPFGLVWNGGAAGRALAQSAYWGMQFKDRLDEAQTRATERDTAAVSEGLAPGYAAHVTRRTKRRFLESRTGRAIMSAAHALKQAAAIAVKPFLWMGRWIYAASVFVGRALVPLVRLIAAIIAFVARAVGKGMDLAAAAIVAATLATAKASVRLWRQALVPGAKWTWTKIVIPASKRFAASAKLAGQWSAKQPGIVWHGVLSPAAKKSAARSRVVWQEFIEARNKYAGERPAAEESKIAEPEPAGAETSEMPEGRDAPGAGKAKKKKKKSKDEDEKVEA